jgi:hypothetical protein
MSSSLGKLLIIIGGLMVILGGILLLVEKIPLVGKLPGDFIFKGKNYTVYFPLATGIVLSLILTFLLNLFGRK